jgi:hypothetical protein
VFRRFKLPALYAAVLIAVGVFLYNLLDFLFNLSDWTTEKKGLWARLWAGAVSREGSVIVTGIIAVFVLSTVLVERRLEAARDLKWKRRKRILDNKTRSISKTKTNTLTDVQRDELFAFQKQIKALYDQATHTAPKTLEADTQAWEEAAGRFLESVLGREHRAFVMDAPHEPATRPGVARLNYLIGWTHKRLERMNALIDELRQN